MGENAGIRKAVSPCQHVMSPLIVQQSKASRVDGESSPDVLTDAMPVGLPPGIPALPGSEKKAEELTLADIMHNMSIMNQNIMSQMGVLQTEIARLQVDMVTKSEFAKLTTRVDKLEQNVSNSPQVSFLKLQLNRLDPANKCLVFKGFSGTIESRDSSIEKFFHDHCAGATIVSIDHVSRGPSGSRTLTPVSIVELSTRNVRETALQAFKGKKLVDSEGKPLTVDRARTAQQQERNSVMRKTHEMIQKHDSMAGKAVSIEWKIEGKKNCRRIMADGEIVFLQEASDLHGTFQGNFAHTIF